MKPVRVHTSPPMPPPARPSGLNGSSRADDWRAQACAKSGGAGPGCLHTAPSSPNAPTGRVHSSGPCGDWPDYPSWFDSPKSNRRLVTARSARGAWPATASAAACASSESSPGSGQRARSGARRGQPDVRLRPRDESWPGPGRSARVQPVVGLRPYSTPAATLPGSPSRAGGGGGVQLAVRKPATRSPSPTISIMRARARARA
jgi:hypothetical protein